jgi:transposase InsO family protein
MMICRATVSKQEEEAHCEVESPHPGFLLAQDTCYVGTIKGIGRIYQQTAIDTHGSYGFAKVYRKKTALTAADLLNDRVLPFYDQYSIRVHRILTDNGPEFCGRQDSHPYELFLHLSGIGHTRTKVRKPQTNGAVERLHQTSQNEFYQMAFRKKLYHTLEEIQTDLDSFMDYYNNQRTHQGRYCQGGTPFQTFFDGLKFYQQYVYENLEIGEAA